MTTLTLAGSDRPSRPAETAPTGVMILTLRECNDVSLVGGKAVNLGELMRAGFNVPDGFVVTTCAYQAARHSDIAAGELEEIIATYYKRIGAGPVAVRSSATAEDMSGASMAGQYETYLDVRSADDLIRRIKDCWASLDTPRTRAYLAEQGIPIERVSMAVVVQRLVAAEVAGVLFTINPGGVDQTQMVIEASWGLGEAVVSGEVQPDSLTLDRADGRVLQATIADKTVRVDPATGHATEVNESQRRKSCLDSQSVHALWKAGLQSEKHFGCPQDMEWAVAEGTVHILQSRAITTAEPMRLRRVALEQAKSFITEALAAGHGPWVPHNIGETLGLPTPLTWGVIRHFLSGSGGFGNLYRHVGFEPGPCVQEDGFVDLIAGRIYMDLSRSPEMFFDRFPFKYDPAQLRGDPQAGQSPPTLPCGPVGRRITIARQLAAVHQQINTLAIALDKQLEETAIPEFLRWLSAERATDLSAMSDHELADAWERRRSKVLDDFAPLSLLPSLIVGQAQADLTSLLYEHVWNEDAATLTRSLSSGGQPDQTTLASQELYEVGKGGLSMDAWLDRHGHRAPDEMDLASARWRERPADVSQLARRLADGASPIARHRQQQAVGETLAQRLREELPAGARVRFDALIDQLRRYVPYRENGKYNLMLGYELLRQVAMEAGRRIGVGNDVFYLTPEELLDCLNGGFAPLEAIHQRKARREASRAIDPPDLIDAESAATLGDHVPTPVSAGNDAMHRGFSISSGLGAGASYVTDDPTDASAPQEGYVLVCRTTDPSWTPLFVNAAAVVLETGGALSHGAIVAREMGVPAVVIADARRLFPTGTHLTVDGRAGTVFAGEASNRAETDLGPDDTYLPPATLPPPPGARERAAGVYRNVAAAAWLIFIGLAMVLPADWVYDPAMRLLDFVLWPIVRWAGPVTATAAIAAGLAILTMILQRVVTDNRRLRVVKQRAAALTRQASKLPPGSARRNALQRAAAVQTRIVGAAMVPVGLLLGPLIFIFMWMPARVDPSVTPPPPGARVIIKANVQGDWLQSVTLSSETITLSSPPTQTTPAIRAALESLRAEWMAAKSSDDLPWDVLAAARATRQQLIASLDSFLSEQMPAQTLAWTAKLPSQPGLYTAHLATGNGSPVDLRIACGRQTLPQPLAITGHPDSVDAVTVVNPPKLADELIFCQPLAFIGNLAPQSQWLFRVASWDIGWLGLYLIGYLPAMFLSRLFLRVA